MQSCKNCTNRFFFQVRESCFHSGDNISALPCYLYADKASVARTIHRTTEFSYAMDQHYVFTIEMQTFQ